MSHIPRKRFGQNFLHDPGVVNRIVAAIDPQPGEGIVEIGPGEGAITAGLLARTGGMDAIEIDRDLFAALEKRFGNRGLRLHSADALRFDFCSLAPAETGLRVVGNLPYNISTPLMFHLLRQATCIRDMHFMLQKEVVDRMAAKPGSRTYGRLSVALQARCRVTPLFDIGPGAFRPAPKVESSFVRLVPLDPLPHQIDDPAVFDRVLIQAFSQRRKTLRNALKTLLSTQEIGQAGIDPGLRPEQVDVVGFVTLANLAATRRVACKPAREP
jgi:16S rRNA (adenine1518-N6/adenine1519-N6)-dimethyltransferase